MHRTERPHRTRQHCLVRSPSPNEEEGRTTPTFLARSGSGPVPFGSVLLRTSQLLSLSEVWRGDCVFRLGWCFGQTLSIWGSQRPQTASNPCQAWPQSEFVYGAEIWFESSWAPSNILVSLTAQVIRSTAGDDFPAQPLPQHSSWVHPVTAAPPFLLSLRNTCPTSVSGLDQKIVTKRS